TESYRLRNCRNDRKAAKRWETFKQLFMLTFKQNKIFNKREFAIMDTMFNFKVSKLSSEKEINIRFENLTNDKSTYRNENLILICVSILCSFVSIISYNFRNDKGMDTEMWEVFAFIAIGFFIAFFITRQNSWKIKLSNNNYIFIYKNIPNKEAADQFVENLFSSRNKYLRENYFVIDENLSYENQLNDLKWLRNIEVISKTEFDDKYSELKSLYKPSKKSIGFEK
ncbi:MAG: hypothetical protein PSV16_04950, partial [Flavobacterium sp.]|nr:hypothetical protein [Flavobacterium sp.]